MHKRLGVRKGILFPLILWWLAMFVATTMPTTQVPRVSVVGVDKLVHAFMYFGLAVLLVRYFYFVRACSVIKALFWVTVITSGYGAFDEWHQQFVGRTMSLGDYVADMLGVVAAVLLIVVYKRIQLKA